MASGELSLTSTSSQEGSHEFPCYPQNERPRKTSTESPKDIDTIKQQYDQAMIELNTLRFQQSDSKRRMDRVMEQLDFYRSQYMAAMIQMEQSAQEGTSLRRITNDNVRLQQRNHFLEKKLSRFVDSMNDNGNSNSTVYSFVEQYSDMQKKFNSTLADCDGLVKPIECCKDICSDLSRDRNSLAVEKVELKQQLTNAMSQLEVVKREKILYREARDKLMVQHNSNLNDIRELTKGMQNRSEEIKRLTAQRNAAEHELRTILAERKGVLEENQKLSDDLSAVKEDLAKLYKDQNKKVFENDNLKCELETVIRYKEDLLKECTSLREKLDEANNKAERDIRKSCDSSWSKETSDSGKEKYNYNEQHALDLETANQDIEMLRKSLERARCDIEKAGMETEVAKSRRDWAINEREKIVQERDSVKILCDELRKERDTAISDLLAAIRDSEKIKKQKDEACREVEFLREQIESQLSSSRRNVRWSYTPYDLEMLQKYDTDVVEIDLSTTSCSNDDDLGISLEGGADDSQNRIDSGIVVVGVTADSMAYGKLRVNDSIIQVNSLDCSSVSKRMVMDAIRNSGPRCSIVVRRQKINKSHMYAVQLNLTGATRNHGISLETGVFIAKIDPGSLASKEDDLAVGDRVLGINSKTMDGITTARDAMSYLDDNRTDSLTIIALKQITQSMDTPSPAATGSVVIKSSPKSGKNDLDSAPNRTIASSNSKSTSKISEMINKFKGKMHITSDKKSGNSVSGNVGGSTASESDSLCQEKDALAELDSVLNNENSEKKTKDNLFKRSKRSKKDSSKSSDKNLGTWPRANIFNSGGSGSSDNNHSGTVVHRKKERPALTLFNMPISLGEPAEDKTKTKKEGFLSSVVPLKLKSPHDISNRNSTHFPVHYSTPANILNRHSVYSTMEAEPILLDNSKSVPSGSMAPFQRPRFPDVGHKHHHHHHNVMNPNRLSLNLTPTSDSSLIFNHAKVPASIIEAKSSLQQNSLDYIPLKSSIDSFLTPKMSSIDLKPNASLTNSSISHHNHPQLDMSMRNQNSIDSFLQPKSPPSLEFAPKPVFPKDATDFYMQSIKRGSRNVSKYPSDSDSVGMDVGLIPGGSNQQMKFQQMMGVPTSRGRLFPAFANVPHHTHPHSMRQTSPLTLPITQIPSIEPGNGTHSTDKLEFEYSQPHHSHGISMDHHDPFVRNKQHPIRDRDTIYGNYGQAYEGGTFPRKKENQRFRIPSNPSVTSKGSGVKNSTGSIEHHSSERGSPMPSFQVEVLSHGASKRNSMPDYCFGHKPSPGDLRRVTIDKSVEPLGITIRCNNNGGGIFVSAITDNSIASQVGLQIGDQLLEVCGINMRAATNELARNVLRQCGNSITMLVQYSPDKYDGNIVHRTTEEDSVSRSGSPTPRNSPRITNRSLLIPPSQSPPPIPIHSSQPPPIMIPSSQRTSVHIPSPQIKQQQTFADSLESQYDTGLPVLESTDNAYKEEPRIITMHTKKSTNLGISLMGGNAVGIYVHDVQKNSLADGAGMRKGDQILEYNGANLRCVTAEQAANEISKPADKVIVVVQHNIHKFNQIKDEAGDSLYIRVGFDRTGDLSDGELRFMKDDVLYVDTTIFRGIFGQWRAWKLDEYGHRLECGIIPSQLKVEEELRLIGDTNDSDGTSSRRGSTSARRSFFRRKKHQRSSSRDSKELASFSNTQLSWFSDSGMLSEEGAITSYQRVERLDYTVCRPVLILGPLSDCVAEKLSIDFPTLFERCMMTTMNCSQETMEKGLQNDIFVDYRRRSNIYECTTIQAIRDVADKNRHCILDVCMSALDRLQRLQIYPIVLLLRFKSAKQIKDIKDSRYSTDKISAKAAKEMYEHALKLESDYRHYISAVISAGVNITHMSTQIKAAVDEEQTKVLWVPVTN